MYKYDYLIYIGRFEPYHLGHHETINTALSLANKVIVLVGSSFAPRDIRNPWSWEERALMIRNAFQNEDSTKVIIKPIRDFPYNDDKWCSQIREVVAKTLIENIDTQQGNKSHFTLRGTMDARVGIIGFEKDASSFYLNTFPEWQTEFVKMYKYNDKCLDATTIRNEYFLEATLDFSNIVPNSTQEFLDDFWLSEQFHKLLEEYSFKAEQDKAWQKTPYPVIFQTSDSVVTQSGHVLLVERGIHPYKGKLALPGGYVQIEETPLECAIRELREETRLKVPTKVLLGSLNKNRRFSHPKRDVRGRYITEAFHFALSEVPDGLPKVKGSDDAAKAEWYPIASLRSDMMAFDHIHIIDDFTGAIV